MMLQHLQMALKLLLALTVAPVAAQAATSSVTISGEPGY